MKPLLATYISLPGTAAEAMQHWQDVFGGELSITRYGDLGLEGIPFDPDPQAVAHSTLVLPGGTIAAGDAMGDGEYPLTGTAYSLLYTAGSADEARTAIGKLEAGGGQMNMPFAVAPWGDWYGQVLDRFGVMWAFTAPAGS
ncbi:VOC family protein [Kocuria varians]|uniref:VOC family protein n=1 Tax=Kocuria varians TaxID=1272 RepID=A0A4Y4D9C6_KOCVA|nr:VOC family protein [Kocuria varians]GEC99887.1 VOC family protein [Kocuria varians]